MIFMVIGAILMALSAFIMVVRLAIHKLTPTQAVGLIMSFAGGLGFLTLVR